MNVLYVHQVLGAIRLLIPLLLVPTWPVSRTRPEPSQTRCSASPHTNTRCCGTLYSVCLLLIVAGFTLSYNCAMLLYYSGLGYNLSTLRCVLLLQVLHTLENCKGVYLRLCRQRTSCRLCTLSPQSCRDWLWSSSGFTATTTTCTEALCQDRRTTTGQWVMLDNGRLVL